MARTVEQIVIDALRLIGEFPFEEIPQKKYIDEGIYVFNLLIDSLSEIGPSIPFFSTLSFNLVPGQGEYSIGTIDGVDVNSEPIIEMDTCFVTYVGVQYPILPIAYSQRDAMGILTQLIALPKTVILQRGDTSCTLSFYPQPDQPYLFTCRMKARLENVSTQQEVHVIPEVNHLFMTLYLGKHLAMRYPTAQFTDMHEAELSRLWKIFYGGNDIDLTANASAILSNRRGFYDMSSIYRGTS